jgi:hypothetical protein
MKDLFGYKTPMTWFSGGSLDFWIWVANNTSSTQFTYKKKKIKSKRASLG